MKLADEQAREPVPPYCVCCEYMRVCDKDGQKVDYCPDPNYRKWLCETMKQGVI